MPGSRARAVFVAVLSAAAILPCPLRAQTARTVYVSALRDRFTPVTDLVATDFALKEDGRVRTILRVEPAVAPMQVAILVDDNGSGIFRSGLARFIQRLQGQAEFSLSSVTGQVLRVVDYTASLSALANGLTKLG